MKKAVLFPIITVVLLVGLLFYQYMSMQTSLPSKGWSRSISLDIQSENPAKPVLRHEGNSNHVYVPLGQTIAHAVYDSKLKLKKQEQIPIQVPFFSKLFVKKQQFLFNKDSNLIVHNKNGKEAVIEKGVTSFSSHDETVVYWKNNQLFQLDTDNWQSKLIAEFLSPVMDVVFDSSSSSFLVILQETELLTKFVLFQPNQSGGYEQTAISSLEQIGSEKMQEVLFGQDGSNVAIIYGTYSSAQGARTYRAYEWNIDLHDKQKTSHPKLIQFRDKQNGLVFENPRYLQIKKEKDGFAILFAADGQTVGKFSGTNIYEAKKENGTWIAGRRSTTSNVALQPFFIGDDAIGWYTFSGKTYSLHASTTDAQVIAKSEDITLSDWKHTSYNTLMSLFGSFMIILFALIWVIAPVVVFVITYLVKTHDFEENRISWLPLMWIGLYVGSQLLFFNTAFHKEKLLFAPEYLTFSGSFVILPVILALLAWGMLKLAKQEDWGNVKSVSYFTIVNVLLCIFLFGPYLL